MKGIKRRQRKKKRRSVPRADNSHTLRQCEAELEFLYPGHAQAQPGEKWTCSCGAVFRHFCDEADGCGWAAA